jgi:hypothetical protein
MVELFTLKVLVEEHWVENQKGESDKVSSDFEVDHWHSFLLYKPANNLDLEIKKCNHYFRLHRQEKKDNQKK